MSRFDTQTGAYEIAAAFSTRITGKVILLTGCSPNSLASTVAAAVARQKPKLLIIAGRSASRLEEAAQSIKSDGADCPLRTLSVDFCSLKSVRRAAGEVNSWSETIDVCVLSAGIMAVDYAETEDGFEKQMATNHFCPFVFVNSIMSKLASPGGRIVVVSSEGHAFHGIGKDLDEINFNGGKTYDRWLSYGQSKSANVLLGVALASRLRSRGITTASLHPGAIKTNLGGHLDTEGFEHLRRTREESWERKPSSHRLLSTSLITGETSPGVKAEWPIYKDLDRGASTYIVAMFDPEVTMQSGCYMQDNKIDLTAAEAHATDVYEAERLWKLSEQAVGEQFRY